MATPRQVRRRGRWSLVIGIVLAALALGAVYAYADNTIIDGDGVTPVTENSSLPFGTVGCDQATQKNVLIAIKRNGSAGSTNVFKNGSSVSISILSTSGAGLSASLGADATLTLPSSWGSDSNNTISSNVSADGLVLSMVTVSSSTTGLGTGSITYRAAGVNSSNQSIARDGTLSVTWTTDSCAPPPPVDTTAPTSSITLTPSSPTGSDGWYTAAVNVQVSATDADDAVAETRCVLDPASAPGSFDDIPSGCAYTEAGAPVSSDGHHTIYAASKDSNGNTESAVVSASFKIDATNPTIDGAVAPLSPDGSNGWYISAPTVTFSCSDVTSGVASCVAEGSSPASDQVTVGESASAQTVTGTATDNAGNTETAAVGGLNIDLSDPTVASWDGSISDGDSYYFGSVPAAPTCTAADAISGPSGCSVAGYSTLVGTHTLTATAHDNAGRADSGTRTYSVLAWTLRGFYQPVDLNGVFNSAKNGSTVPLKFEIFAGPSELTDTADVKSLAATQITCGTNVVLDDIEVTATGGTSLRYDLSGGQFIYNWQTPKKPGNCYRVTMTTLDGSFVSALFKLK